MVLRLMLSCRPPPPIQFSPYCQASDESRLVCRRPAWDASEGQVRSSAKPRIGELLAWTWLLPAEAERARAAPARWGPSAIAPMRWRWRPVPQPRRPASRRYSRAVAPGEYLT